ncbi:MAG: hypothetical protein ACE1ZQ_08495 [Ignavibacteriaceae bacterium]
MNNKSVKFTGKNICEVIEFMHNHREERQDVPFMKLLNEGCDVFCFWFDGRKEETEIFRMEKGEILTHIYRIPTIPPKAIKFTGLNIVEIVQFIEEYKNLFICEGYQVYRGSDKISNGSMKIWWDCDSMMLNLDNLKDGKSQVSGCTAYNFVKGDIWIEEKEKT